MSQDAVVLTELSFRYSAGAVAKGPVVLEDVSLRIARGSRVLVVGGNGAGKSTLLRVVGGMHMISPASSCLVLGKEAFADLTLNPVRVLLQTEWATRSVAFAGYAVPLTGDFPVSEMHADWQERYPERRAELIEVLGLDLSWKMHSVSDGQRRRVQLFLNLLRPFEIVLLDEVLSVLDVLVRQNVLRYIKKECETRGATCLYATHIFDGLEEWPSDMSMGNLATS
jgi:CCR4-NOT complex subunit CAF16